MKKSKVFLCAMLLFNLISGCGGGGDSDNPPEVNDKVIAEVRISDGNNQSATVGTELPLPLTALILNSSGQPIPGQIVNFRVTVGNGTVFAGAAVSDSSGIAKERWTLGTTAGAQKVEVRAVDSTGAAVVFATFDAVAVAAAPQSVAIASGDLQSAIQLQSLPLPAQVIVKDSYGNPVSGVSVTFTANNGGTVTPQTAVTGATGEAAATWTLGQAIGTQTLTAVVAGFPPLTFNGYAHQAPPTAPTALVKSSGDLQTVVQHLTLPAPLQVLVTDVLGNPVPNAQVTFTESPGSPYVPPLTVATDLSGNASWSGSGHYFHTAGEQGITASVDALAPVTFEINVTPSTHRFDGAYVCDVNFVDGVIRQDKFYPIFANGICITDTKNTTMPTTSTLNEETGEFSRVDMVRRTTPWLFFSGFFTVDAAGVPSGSGTWYEQVDVGPGPYLRKQEGVWSCVRQ